MTKTLSSVCLNTSRILTAAISLIALNVSAATTPKFSATASGTASNLSVTAKVNISDSDVGRTGKTYLVAGYNGMFFAHNGTTWTSWSGGTLPAYSSGTLSNRTIEVVSNVDLSSIPGTQVYVGYGTSETDMVTNGKYGHVFTTPPANVKPVLPSSYENKMAAASAVGPQVLPADAGSAIAYADFFQDGSYSMVTHTLTYSSTPNWQSQYSTVSTRLGQVHFYRNEGGQWVDRTSSLLTQTTGCLHPRKAVVADFNKDGKPDVFFACHGFDASPFPGEQPVLLLSQPDGTYSNTKLPITGFFHSASAADINGDGYPDILVTDNIVEHTPPFLINNQDGTFTKDVTRFPDSMTWKPIFSAELVDFFGTGRYDAFIAGNEQGTVASANFPATLIPNDGNGKFISTTPVVLPSLPGYGFALDVVFTRSAIYLLRTIDSGPNFYNGTAIQKISYPSMTSQSLYQHTGDYPHISGLPWASTWIDWIIPYNGNIVPMNGAFAAYNVSVPQ